MPEPPSIKKSKNGNHYTNVRVWASHPL
jgi:hypothetical protein